MALTSKCIAAVFCVVALSSGALAQDNSNYTNGVNGTVTAVFLDNSASFAICVYPNSVSSTLPV